MRIATFLVLIFTLGVSPWCGAANDFEQRAEAIDSQQLGEVLSREGWLRLGFDDVPHTEFEKVDESIRIEATASNALIYRKLSDEETKARFMSWSWRADALPPSKTLTKVDDDDRAIALYVIFEIEPRKLSLWGRIRSSVVARFSGLPKGQILTYVWGSDDAVGEWFANPYIRGTGRVKVLRNATHPLRSWLEESVDLKGDFIDAFGYEPIKPIYLALSADTEDSGAQSLSWIRDIQLGLDEPAQAEERARLVRRSGETRLNSQGAIDVWDEGASAWLTPEEFWQNYADSLGGLRWGQRTTYPPYSEVREQDLMLIELDSGVCLMEFWHRRWRRAQDVRRWSPRFNQHGACPFVFDSE